MNDIRAMIRELLTEEIAALRAEMLGGAQVERVPVGTQSALTAFALSILDRAQDPGFVTALRGGHLHFAPDGVARPMPGPVPHHVAAPPVTLVASVPAKAPEVTKTLITERDIAAVDHGATRLRVRKNARFTPLAGDEARRRGIRIERTLP